MSFCPARALIFIACTGVPGSCLGLCFVWQDIKSESQHLGLFL